MPTLVLRMSMCDNCSKLDSDHECVIGEKTVYQLVPGWYRTTVEDHERLVFCSEPCLYEWVEEHISPEAAQKLKDSVWIA